MRLFVYGTLLEASGAPAARWLAERITASRRASVAGRLCAIATPRGCYPALLTPQYARDRVLGSVCDLVLRAGELARLDRYEGREYRREVVGAYPLEGRPAVIRASAYRWRGPLPAHARPIAGGDFLAWLAVSGAHAYVSPGLGAWR